MASVEKRTRNGRVTWRAHYRDPVGQQRNRSFPRKVDAEQVLDEDRSVETRRWVCRPEAGGP